MSAESERTPTWGTTASGAAWSGYVETKSPDAQLASITESIMQARPDLALNIRQRSFSDLRKLEEEWSKGGRQEASSTRESLQHGARLLNAAMAAFPVEVRERVAESGTLKFPPDSSEAIRLTMLQAAIQAAIREVDFFMIHGGISPMPPPPEVEECGLNQTSPQGSEHASKVHSKFFSGSLLFGGLFCICLCMALYALYEDESPSLSWVVLLSALWSSGVFLWEHNKIKAVGTAQHLKAWAVKTAVFVGQTLAWALCGTLAYVVISSSMNPGRSFALHDYFFAGSIVAIIRVTIVLLFRQSPED